MLKFRTTKKVDVSLQKTGKSLLEFQYACYFNLDESMLISVEAYKIDAEGNVTLLPGQGGRRILPKDVLNELLEQVKPITPVVENPLDYLFALIKSGIKLIIVSEGLWKGSLTMKDFE